MDSERSRRAAASATRSGQSCGPSDHKLFGDLSFLRRLGPGCAAAKQSQRAHGMGREFIFLGTGWLLNCRGSRVWALAFNGFLEYRIGRNRVVFDCGVALELIRSQVGKFSRAYRSARAIQASSSRNFATRPVYAGSVTLPLAGSKSFPAVPK